MAIGEAGRQRLQTQQFAPVDVAFFVELGAPARAFDEDGILDVDQLIELGWKIDDDADSFEPPNQLAEDTGQPE